MHMPLVLTNRRRRGGSAFAFSPSTLFSTTAIGIWLDPSDLSTMFSDRAGTTPVTTPGSLVGVRLDKSKGLVLGSELILNGTFATNLNDWPSNVSATWDAGAALLSATTASAQLAQSFTTVVGRAYRLEYQFVSGNTGNSSVRVGIAANSTTIANITMSAGAGSFSRIFVATATTTWVTLFVNYPAVSITGKWDNISVKELAGNHAFAPTDAARMTYGIEPKTGTRNLLLATDTLSTQSLTVTAVPHTLAFTGTGTVTLTGASTAGPLVGTGAGNRVSLTFTPTAASLTLTVSGSVTLGQLERGSSATAYQRVTTAFDVTEAGVPTTHYVQYDGTNSSMSTSAIDFTLTDAMSVFAGVWKRSDAALGTVLESSTDAVNTAGSFSLRAPNTTASAAYSYLSRGTALALIASPTSYAAPIYNLVSGLSDISADQSIIRVNGAQVASSAADQGTGNYGNHALFIGRRNNTSLPFSGRDYGIIVVGKAASAGEITDTETWLAARTAQVTL